MEQPRLTVNIKKSYGVFNLEIDFVAGTEILVLFGPSGAGKTQTLNAIAGLVTPDSGEITLDGRRFLQAGPGVDPVDLPVRNRGVGYVFQQYALFPHLTALENVAYPLWRKSDSRQRAMALLERMRLTAHANQYPHELSGGQQQRVAIARALAAEPKLLLFDEPFSALDAPIRELLHEDLRALQAESRLVVLYVTHNLDDALAVGHRLAVLIDGRVSRIGKTEDVYLKPGSLEVMEALGIPNRLNATVKAVTEKSVILDWDGVRLAALEARCSPGDKVCAYLRPEQIGLSSPGAGSHVNGRITGIVESLRLNRGFATARIALDSGDIIEARAPHHKFHQSIEPGLRVSVEIPPEAVVILPAKAEF